MRIGLFTDTYFPATNGAVYMAESIRVNLESMGHEVFVVAPKKGLRGPRREGGTIWMPSIGSMFYEDQLTSVFFPPRELKSIEKLQLDIVMMYTPGQIGLLGAYSAKKLDVPLVSQYVTDVSEYISDYPNVLPGVIALALSAPFALKLSLSELAEVSRRIVRGKYANATPSQNLVIKLITELHNHCDAVVAVSSKVAQKLKSWDTTCWIPIIPAGVDALRVSPSEVTAFKNKFKLRFDDKVIMYVGRLAEEKNLDLLIDAFVLVAKQDDTIKLVFVGDYMYKPQLEAHAAQTAFADRIIFAGKYPREKLGSVYAVADVFAFPSITDTQGLVVNEAAHAGLPFVWIDGSLNEVLVDGITGYKAENNPKDFARKIQSLIKNETLREDMGKSAQILAMEKTELRQAEIMEGLMKSLITNRR